MGFAPCVGSLPPSDTRDATKRCALVSFRREKVAPRILSWFAYQKEIAVQAKEIAALLPQLA